mmetsp:Transcript_26024/g.65604  ORF Transcript_26024/g.65604 Transcript_26024/m.65604 type:complete len:203 (-) Transcript_26024:7-615(-)
MAHPPPRRPRHSRTKKKHGTRSRRQMDLRRQRSPHRIPCRRRDRHPFPLRMDLVGRCSFSRHPHCLFPGFFAARTANFFRRRCDDLRFHRSLETPADPERSSRTDHFRRRRNPRTRRRHPASRTRYGCCATDRCERLIFPDPRTPRRRSSRTGPPKTRRPKIRRRRTKSRRLRHCPRPASRSDRSLRASPHLTNTRTPRTPS